MPSTFTDSLGLELQANGENLNTWGEKANGVFNLIEEATAGYVAVTISGNTTLTITDGTESSGATDQARNALIKLTGAPGAAFNLTLPEVSKSWVIWNGTNGAATIRTATATTTVALPVDQIVVVFADGAGNVLQAGPLITDAGVLPFDQIENASGITVSATQWGYLGELDQALKTTDNVTFADGALTGTLDVTGAATITGLAYPSSDGSAGQYVTTDGAGNLSFGTPAGAGDLLASANLSDLANAATARTNLGLDGDYLEAGNNLSDVSDASVARTNLALAYVTQSEAETGTLATGSMTPLRTAQAIAALAPSPQFLQTVKTDTATTTSTTYADLMSVTITLADAANKVNLRALVGLGTNSSSNGASFRFQRGGTTIGVGATAGSRDTNSFSGSAPSAVGMTTVGGEFLDTPGSVGPHTYTLQWRARAANACHVNRSDTDSDTIFYQRSISTLSAQEVF